MTRAHWRDPALGSGAPRRDLHLVNLDEHADHPGYDGYLEAKHRVIRTLEDFFGSEIRFSCSLWYPPSGYRLWHTDETQPGWRMHVVDFDERPEASFFRYMDPRTHEIVTLRERPRTVRFFKIEQDPRRLLWHCVANPAPRAPLELRIRRTGRLDDRRRATALRSAAGEGVLVAYWRGGQAPGGAQEILDRVGELWDAQEDRAADAPDAVGGEPPR
ncbi:hypothetical protein [Actinomadura sp. DC4]|uniref:hypothetical protein n=1 Tax=Actinomadura sp. DC4 TaxID=3055069 RepID=UPI0025AF0A72|nr:hypothetical protein [Actinomadura sp. DC4]MDN3353269.1 hypothetical protein [Actinomadura sp. DC4]